jgi:hypothetical protein|nr:hypothetical protein [Candidatus Krumholzibacteria bacterium]
MTRKILLGALVCLQLIAAGSVFGQQELSYEQYRALAWAADRLDHVAMFEPMDGQTGMYLVIAERFGTVQVVKMTPRGAQRDWKSNQLSGIPEEVITADLNNDGLEDAILCRTSNGKVYVWDMDGYTLLWESLPSEYQKITAFTTASMDEDPPNEIVLIADRRLVYIDGVSFNKDWTSIDEYEATMVRCGDVDGDGRVEVVLNTGKVLDSVSGSVEWEEQSFYQFIELLDIDGDGMPEVLTENGFGGPLKVFDMDYGNEVRFQ